MESQSYSQTHFRHFVRCPAGRIPAAAGVTLELNTLANLIESSMPPGESGAVRSAAAGVVPVVLRPGEAPEDRNLYEGRYPVESLRLRRFYNIGGGAFTHPYWTNIDRVTEWYPLAARDRPRIDMDLISMERLPIADQTAELVYSGHLLEHLPDASARHVLREAFRILKPGGVLRVSTPDIQLEYRAYKENDWHYFSCRTICARPGYDEHWLRGPLGPTSIQQLFLYRFASHVSTLHAGSTVERIEDSKVDELFRTLPLEEALDYCTSRCDPALQEIYPGNHISWWSFEKMRRSLQEAGFRRIYRSGYGQSFAPPLRNTKLFDTMLPSASLYVEARK